jgi:hypothetical protein
MLYNEIIAVCSQIRRKDINTPCGQTVELLNQNQPPTKGLTEGGDLRRAQSASLDLNSHSCVTALLAQ